MTELEESISQMHHKGKPFVLVSIAAATGSIPRHQGARMVVYEDGTTKGTIGGGILEADAIQAALRLFATQQDSVYPFSLSSRQAALSDMICGGSGEISLAYYGPEREIQHLLKECGKLYIFGGGHVSQSLAQAAQIVEIPAIVLDDREEFANQTRFPHAKCIVLKDYANIPSLEIGPDAMIGILTRGHLGDADVLRWAVRQNAGYIGMIGSLRKRDMLYQQLIAEGVPRERLTQVYSPIGLEIGSETPGEIAISIMAELIKVRAEWRETATQ